MRKFTFLKQLWMSLIVASIPSVTMAVGPSIGDMAENIAIPTEMLTKLALIACYAIGVAFIFAALAQYKIHRQSPKLVPLTTPIVLLVLGFISIMIPYSTGLFGETFSAVVRAKDEGRYDGKNVLPLPDVSKQGPLLPLPQSPEQSQPQSQPQRQQEPPPSQEIPSSSDSSGGGHWTSDPRYNQ